MPTAWSRCRWRTPRKFLALAQAQLAKETAMLKAIAAGKADRRWVDELLRQRGCEF